MKIFVIATAFVALAATPAALGSDTYLDYLTDAWTTIMDHNETGKWSQSITTEGAEISTVKRAGCVDNLSVCLLSKRVYPSGDTVEEYIPLNS